MYKKFNERQKYDFYCNIKVLTINIFDNLQPN